jgi:hypothetical protein
VVVLGEEGTQEILHPDRQGAEMGFEVIADLFAGVTIFE